MAESPSVQLLHIPDCPGWRRAERNLREALDATGNDQVQVSVRVIGSAGDAANTAFGGSPTILIDGRDPFVGAPTTELACRVYLTEDGLAPSPTTHQFIEVLRGSLRN